MGVSTNDGQTMVVLTPVLPVSTKSLASASMKPMAPNLLQTYIDSPGIPMKLQIDDSDTTWPLFAANIAGRNALHVCNHTSPGTR